MNIGDDYSHTGAPTVTDLRLEFYKDFYRDIIDAPNFIPCGFHFSNPRDGAPIACHAIRPGAFASTK